MKEIAVAKVDDLQNGQMQQITVNDSQILLAKINEKFYATGAFCTHYGAPLEKGILCGETIVCPFKKILGDKLGKMFQKAHEQKGVTFKFGTKATKFTGDGKVKSAVLDNGETIATDLVVVGIGVEPNTSYIEGIELNEKDHSIPVNEYLQTEIPDIYAAGDIARFPYASMKDSTRIEHWRLAAQHGRIAAENMLSKGDSRIASTVDNIVPFFWSEQYNLKLRYVGHAEKWDEIYIDGDLDLDKPEFLAFYLQNNRVMAVAGINRDRDIAAISQLMRLQKMPDGKTVKDKAIDWIQEIKVASSKKARN